VSFNDEVGQNTTDPNSAGLFESWSRINIAAGSIPNGKYYLGFVEYKGQANPGFDLQKYVPVDGTVSGSTTSYVINGLGGYLAADFDLDDDVDFDDLLTLARNYNQPTGRTYVTGDTNVDGDVDFDDLLTLARAYNQHYTGPVNLAGTSAAFQADYALAQSLVPEPTVLGSLAVAGLALGRRRR
jgi:hypothetical protein